MHFLTFDTRGTRLTESQEWGVPVEPFCNSAIIRKLPNTSNIPEKAQNSNSIEEKKYINNLFKTELYPTFLQPVALRHIETIHMAAEKRNTQALVDTAIHALEQLNEKKEEQTEDTAQLVNLIFNKTVIILSNLKKLQRKISPQLIHLVDLFVSHQTQKIGGMSQQSAELYLRTIELIVAFESDEKVRGLWEAFLTDPYLSLKDVRIVSKTLEILSDRMKAIPVEMLETLLKSNCMEAFLNSKDQGVLCDKIVFHSLNHLKSITNPDERKEWLLAILAFRYTVPCTALLQDQPLIRACFALQDDEFIKKAQDAAPYFSFEIAQITLFLK